MLVHRPTFVSDITVKLGDQSAASKPEAAPAGEQGEDADPAETDKVLHERLEVVGKFVDATEKALEAKARYHLKSSFRQITFQGLYELKPTLNKAENLAGMVTSAKGRAAFEFAKEWGERAGRFAKVITIADESWQLRHRYADLLDSNRSPAEKFDMSRDYIASIAARVAVSTIFDADHELIWAAKHVFGADTTRTELGLARLETFVRNVTDPDQIHAYRVYIRSHLHIPAQLNPLF